MVIVVDTREQLPYAFDPERVQVVRRTLPAGDYSIEGFENRVAIERKTLDDLVSTVIHARERFGRELTELRAYDFACIVVEADFEDVLEHRYRGYARPLAIVGAVAAIVASRGIPVFFLGDRQNAVLFVEKLLEKAHARLTAPPVPPTEAPPEAPCDP